MIKIKIMQKLINMFRSLRTAPVFVIFYSKVRMFAELQK
mgnify:CR=1 FL=1